MLIQFYSDSLSNILTMSASNLRHWLIAVKAGDYDRVKSLLENQAENNHKNNYMVLVKAITEKKYEIVELLLEHGFLEEEKKGDVYCTSLDYAEDDTQMLKILLRAGAPIAGKNFQGCTALIRAFGRENFSAVDTMLSMYQVDSIDPTNKNEMIHFCIACVRDRRTLVEHFIKKGMNVNVVLDGHYEKWSGFTPLHLALQYLSSKVIETLLSHGARFIFEGQKDFSLLHRAYYAWKNPKYANRAGPIVDLFLSAHQSIIANPVDPKGLSHFYIACVRNNKTLVENFLLSGVDLKIGKNTLSPLHGAVKHNCPEIVVLLLSHKLKCQDVDSKDMKGCTPLHLALQYKFYVIVELLLTFNANVNIKDQEGYTPIHKAFFDSSGIPGLLIDLSKSKLANVASPENLSVFHIACARGNVDLVEYFISECDVDVNEQVMSFNECVARNSQIKWYGFTALHFAAVAQNLQIVQLLLNRLACTKATDARGVTALWYALDSQPKYRDVRKFIEGNCMDKLALLPNNSESVKDEIVNSMFDHFDHVRILKLLLDRGSEVNYKDLDGKPLLFQAYQSIVRGLVMNVDDQAQDVIHEICCKYFFQNAKEITRLLVSHGINQNPRDTQKNSIFHLILNSMLSHEQVTDIALEVVDILISSGGNPTLTNGNGDSPLLMAIKNGSVEFVQLLLKYNCDINGTDKDMKTPLHILLERGYRHYKNPNEHKKMMNMIHFLVASGAAVDARDTEGQTPLFKTFNLNAMQILLAADCDVNARDRSGRTALSFAIYGNADAVKLLLDYGADINITNNNNISLLRQFKRNDYHNVKICEILAAHVEKLKLISYHVSIENLRTYNHSSMFRLTNSKACELIYELNQELEKLKEKKLDAYTSLYDILFKSVHQMTRHVKNPIFTNILSNNYPNYGYILKLQHTRGRAAKGVLDQAFRSFRLLSKNQLSDSDIDSIFIYLSDRDLKNLALVEG